MIRQYRIVIQHNNTQHIHTFNSYKQCNLYIQCMNKKIRYYGITYNWTEYITDFNFEYNS
jgi:hypothetical protein